jgi:GAF domain-containing protein
VFHVALNHNADIFIADIDADTIKARVPAWYRGAINAASFLLLPMLVDKRVVGLVYADCEQAGQLVIPSRELALLKTLRNQAILAIRQQRR